MPQPFIAYYEHLAKLAQVANKQTMFLAHLLYYMEFDKDNRQYYIDLSTLKKQKIMAEISPGISPKNRLAIADQYLNKFKKLDFIRSLGSGVWLVNPICYGQYRPVSKALRTDNARMYVNMEFTADRLVRTKIKIDSPEAGETEEYDSNEALT